MNTIFTDCTESGNIYIYIYICIYICHTGFGIKNNPVVKLRFLSNGKLFFSRNLHTIFARYLAIYPVIYICNIVYFIAFQTLTFVFRTEHDTFSDWRKKSQVQILTGFISIHFFSRHWQWRHLQRHPSSRDCCKQEKSPLFSTLLNFVFVSELRIVSDGEIKLRW